ncbi:hypothetical protein RHGRI_014964 [Rhododendron griersonianum]|uniref:Uncharacterized protein n=1 Tax=Rhododendron griersonianum TaxID=479676 RepID=A0AAV6KBY9_9ERIC|nr:hypothetical protein RHGRI_014964 [Rhododendron griersonianum]
MGLTKEHFDGEVVGHQINSPSPGAKDNNVSQFASTTSQEIDHIKLLDAENRKGKAFVDGWGERMHEMSVLLEQRVHAILWLKELEEEEEKKLGHPLVDSVELLLDTYPDLGTVRMLIGYVKSKRFTIAAELSLVSVLLLVWSTAISKYLLRSHSAKYVAIYHVLNSSHSAAICCKF